MSSLWDTFRLVEEEMSTLEKENAGLKKRVDELCLKLHDAEQEKWSAVAMRNDALNRREKAESEVKRLREALEKIADKDMMCFQDIHVPQSIAQKALNKQF